ncbi:MAG TPA: hypothetical protein VFS19_02555, partial [Planctomycetota bacterium]|nr:hypothetical protein [Planctomycetota bacterium]
MRLLIPAILAIFALGCMDREEEYTLNPDGSGKAVISWVAAPFDPFGMGGARDPDQIMKKLVRGALSEIPGIDCWKDVTFTLRPDGKIAFKGTA